MQTQPQLIIYTGPMFGSKTTRMLTFLERSMYQNKKVVAFKPKLDDRYSKSRIKTHAGMEFDAINVNSGRDILSEAEKYDVVGIDEAFMIDGVADSALSLYRKGKTVVISSIQLSATGKPFSEIKDLLPWATKIEVCPAVCVKTGDNAYYTTRKTDSVSEIAIGGSDMYEPRAWSHTPFINCRFGDENVGAL